MKKYTDTNEYVLVKGKIGTVGISTQKLEELGDVVHVDLPPIGKEVKKGDVLFSIEAIKTENDIPSPLSGKVVEVNKELENDPEAINSDPEGEGWICKIELSDEDEIKALKDK
jgi:glycine cleavage system H protein